MAHVHPGRGWGQAERFLGRSTWALGLGLPDAGAPVRK